jgi:hypothetical protein
VLSSTASGQLQSQHEYKQQQYDNTGQTKPDKQKKQQKQRKKNQVRPLTLKHEFLKIFVSLQTAFEVETHLAEG